MVSKRKEFNLNNLEFQEIDLSLTNHYEDFKNFEDSIFRMNVYDMDYLSWNNLWFIALSMDGTVFPDENYDRDLNILLA